MFDEGYTVDGSTFFDTRAAMRASLEETTGAKEREVGGLSFMAAALVDVHMLWCTVWQAVGQCTKDVYHGRLPSSNATRPCLNALECTPLLWKLIETQVLADRYTMRYGRCTKHLRSDGFLITFVGPMKCSKVQTP